MLKQPHEIIELFRLLHLHATGNRLTVYAILQATGRAMTVADVVRAGKQALDRVSVHRALKLFSKKGLAASIPGGGGSERYLLVHPANKKSPAGPQLMTICMHCQKTEISQLDASYWPDEMNAFAKMHPQQVLVTGICEACGRQQPHSLPAG